MQAYTLVVAALLLNAAVAQAEPDKIAYELQERCAKAGKDYFLKHNVEGVHSWSGEKLYGFRESSYLTNYNSNTNRCYILITHRESSTRLAPDDRNDAVVQVMTERLVDVLSNGEVGAVHAGRYWLIHDASLDENGLPDFKTDTSKCTLAARKCSSLVEWKTFISAYIEPSIVKSRPEWVEPKVDR